MDPSVNCRAASWSSSCFAWAWFPIATNAEAVTAES